MTAAATATRTPTFLQSQILAILSDGKPHTAAGILGLLPKGTRVRPRDIQAECRALVTAGAAEVDFVDTIADGRVPAWTCAAADAPAELFSAAEQLPPADELRSVSARLDSREPQPKRQPAPPAAKTPAPNPEPETADTDAGWVCVPAKIEPLEPGWQQRAFLLCPPPGGKCERVWLSPRRVGILQALRSAPTLRMDEILSHMRAEPAERDSIQKQVSELATRRFVRRQVPADVDKRSPAAYPYAILPRGRLLMSGWDTLQAALARRQPAAAAGAEPLPAMTGDWPDAVERPHIDSDHAARAKMAAAEAQDASDPGEPVLIADMGRDADATIAAHLAAGGSAARVSPYNPRAKGAAERADPWGFRAAAAQHFGEQAAAQAWTPEQYDAIAKRAAAIVRDYQAEHPPQHMSPVERALRDLRTSARDALLEYAAALGDDVLEELILAELSSTDALVGYCEREGA